MILKRTKKGLSSLTLFAFLLIGCFFNLNGQHCYIPTNVVSNNITPTTATLNWDAMPNATAYEVNYRPMNAPATQPWTTVTTPTHTVTINALLPSTMYDVQVRSVCRSTFSDYTVTTSFSTQNCIPPMNPSVSNLTANTADVQWTAVPGASGYQLLYRIAVSDGTPDPWTTVSSVNNAYNLTGLTANTLYAGRLITDCGGFPSDTSKVFYFSTNPCAVPSNLMITAQTASSVALAWDAVPSANQYNVQYRTAGNGTWSTINTNTNSRTINGLTSNTAYEFRVRSNCGGGITSAYTLIIKGFTLPCAMPENAVISNVTVNSATVSWNNATGANQYRVEYREALSPTWTTINANNTTKTITGLTPNTDYEARVRTKCTGNQYSAYTETLTFQTKSCAVPQGLQATNVQFTSAQLSWNPVENATRYQLQYRLIGDTTWATTNPDSTIRTINGLIPDSQYEARVRTRCANNTFSDYSLIITFRTNICVVPTGLRIAPRNQNSVIVSWDTQLLATGYRVEYRIYGEINWITRNTQNNFIILNALQAGNQYDIRIMSKCSPNVLSSPTETISFLDLPCSDPLNPIKLMTVTNIGQYNFTIGWNNLENIDQTYSLYGRQKDIDGWGFWTEIHTNEHTIDPYLKPDTEYEFRIVADNLDVPLCMQTIKVKTKDAPKFPYAFSVTRLNDNRVMAFWMPSSDTTALFYELSYRGNNLNLPWTTINIPYHASEYESFILENFNYNSPYQFRLTTIYPNNIRSLTIEREFTFNIPEPLDDFCGTEELIVNLPEVDGCINCNMIGDEYNQNNPVPYLDQECNTPGQYQNRDCYRYAPKVNHIDHTPIKYIRVNFHFMKTTDRNYPMNFSLDSDGWGNMTQDKENGRSVAFRSLQSINSMLRANERRYHEANGTIYANESPTLPKRIELVPARDDRGEWVYEHRDNAGYRSVNLPYNLANNCPQGFATVHNIYMGYGTVGSRQDINFPSDFVNTLQPRPTVPITANTQSIDGISGGIGGQWIARLWTMSYLDSRNRFGNNISRWSADLNQLWIGSQTMVHELGHSLGLRHTWEGPDGLLDTPTQNEGNPGGGNAPVPQRVVTKSWITI